MKTHKINSFKTGLTLSLGIFLLLSSCAESGKNDKTPTENNAKAKTIVAVPKIDLQTAIMSNNLKMVKQHIKAGTDINKKDQMSGATPLISAVTFGKTSIVKVLIAAKTDLSFKNNDGATALHVAAFFCHVEIVQLLIAAKADKTLKNNFGMTPRESVMGPFAEIKPFYEMLQQQLGPFGLEFDLNEIEKTRPVIAMMLQ
ncbi:ankyrin repeat domain containing protein [Psychroflexus torquis ATCC 700755]|uniref:Ankyrin repeat domain containing protein n=1 Tax=Psychroflexus torquis (strain ATCC 700755 / CIP 106069 / ACAM 623) TaxID=313595 RepID=K4IE78_PSYTT|nr:ankyrin repeat domain-containing protein [Psychroflexus torquis]AFU67401.1 ankyrin repeat domain containing protein [Psychroflexus torquis ATCC 700755]